MNATRNLDGLSGNAGNAKQKTNGEDQKAMRVHYESHCIQKAQKCFFDYK